MRTVDGQSRQIRADLTQGSEVTDCSAARRSTETIGIPVDNPALSRISAPRSASPPMAIRSTSISGVRLMPNPAPATSATAASVVRMCSRRRPCALRTAVRRALMRGSTVAVAGLTATPRTRTQRGASPPRAPDRGRPSPGGAPRASPPRCRPRSPPRRTG